MWWAYLFLHIFCISCEGEVTDGCVLVHMCKNIRLICLYSILTVKYICNMAAIISPVIISNTCTALLFT